MTSAKEVDTDVPDKELGEGISEDNENEEKKSQQELFDELKEERKLFLKCSKHSIWSKLPASASCNNEQACLQCAEADRKFIAKIRDEASDNKTFFTYMYLNPIGFTRSRLPKNLFRGLIILLIQLIIPIAIIVQTLENENEEGKFDFCPHNSDVFARCMAFLLSVYFGFMAQMNCEGKLRGMMFLLMFIPLQGVRKHLLHIAVVAQFAGIILAYAAQHLVFISSGDLSYLRLLFVSLTMVYTLNVDRNLKSSGESTKTSAALDKLSEDKLLGGGVGVGDEGEPVPTSTAVLVHRLRQTQFIILHFVLFLSFFLTVVITVCI